MSWFGDSLTNLRGQLTNFTRDVIHDVVESVQGGDEEAEESEGVIPTSAAFLKEEVERLQQRNKELETQLDQLSSQHRKARDRDQANEGDVVLMGIRQHQPLVEGSETWKQIQEFVASAGLELPSHLGERLSHLAGETSVETEIDLNYPRGTPEGGETEIAYFPPKPCEECRLLKERISALEHQLEELDVQWDSELQAALAERAAAVEENRKLKAQLSEKSNVEVEELEKELSELKLKSEELSLRSASLERENQHLKSELRTQTEQLDALNQTCSRLRSELEKPVKPNDSQEISQLSDEVNQLRSKLEGYDHLTDENDTLKGKILALENLIARTNEAHEGEKSEFEAQLVSLAQKNEELSKSNLAFTDIKKEHETLLQRLAGLESEKGELESQVATLTEKNEEYLRKMSFSEGLVDENENLLQQLASLKGEKGDLEVQVTTLLGEKSELHSKISDSEERIGNLALQIENLKGEKGDLEARVATMVREKGEFDAIHSERQRKTEELQEQIRSLEGEKGDLTTLVAKLQDEIAALLEQIHQYEIQSQIQEQEREGEKNQQGEINKLREKLEGASQTIQEQRQRIEDLLTERDADQLLVKENSDLQVEVEQHKMQLSSLEHLKTEANISKDDDEPLETSTEAVETLNRQLAKLQHSLETANGENATLTRRLQDLELLQGESSVLEGEVTELRKLVDDRNSALEALKRENGELLGRLEALKKIEGESENLKGEVTDLRKLLEERIIALEGLKYENETLLGRQEQLQNIEGESGQLKGEVVVLQKLLEDRNSLIETFTLENEELQGRLEELCNVEGESDKLKGEVTKLQQELAAQSAALQEKQLQISTLQSVKEDNEQVLRRLKQLENIEGEYENLKGEVATLQQRLKDQKSQTDDHLSQISALKKENKKHLGRLEHLEKVEGEYSLLKGDFVNFQGQIEQQKALIEEQLSEISALQTVQEDYERLQGRLSELENLGGEYDTFKGEVAKLTIDLEERNQRLKELEGENEQLQGEVSKLKEESGQLSSALVEFQQQREQLVQTVHLKHQEALAYHAENQRLAKICEDLQASLKATDELKPQLMRSRNEAETARSVQTRLQAEIDRLRSHLLVVEENYTQEAIRSEQHAAALQQRLEAAEQQLQQQNTVGLQASAQADTLQDQLRAAVAERDKVEILSRHQAAALQRLQNVLEQFTRDKERDLLLAQQHNLQKLEAAEREAQWRSNELLSLQEKLAEAQAGLEAAGRLTQQLDARTAALNAAKEETKALESELERLRKESEQLKESSSGRVDRSLVKNLVVGYFSAPVAKRTEVLRIIATVLDFSAEERTRAGVDESASGLSGWASSMLKGGVSRLRTASGTPSAAMATEKSLSEAFIRFLESESVPQTPPRLPAQQMASDALQSGERGSRSHSRTSSGTQSALLAPVTTALPVLTPFQPGRNEPTILRDVLRDT